MESRWRQIEDDDRLRRHRIGSVLAVVVVLAAAVGLVRSLLVGSTHGVVVAVMWMVGMTVAWLVSRYVLKRGAGPK